MAIYRGPGGSGDATTDATNQASVASDAAAAALVSQTAAANSATNAATSATAAASSASGASTSATNAANSATSAASSASTATTQATNAATSASNAATSASNAATSAADAATTYDNFDDRYLGSKASAPTLDNDGNALLTGALYWNSTSNTMNVWTGLAWTGLGASSGVSSFSAGSTGFTPSTSTTGAITLAGTLAVANGGTGSTTASGARTNLGLGSIATQASNSVSITGGSISGITDLAVADGGTGASTAANARTNLGLGSMATQASSSVSITGGSITGITDLAIADGGTGASTATAAFNNLNPMTTTGDIIYELTSNTAARLPIGSAGQVLTVVSGLPAWSAATGGGVSSFNTRTGAVTLSSSDVTTALTYTPLNPANNLSEVTASTARTNLSVPSTTGSGATGTWNIDILGNAGTVTNGVYTTGNQTIGGTKTFSSTISGSIDGNAATVTNGVVTTGSYANPSWITSLAETKVLPSQTSNSGKYLTTNGTSTSWATVSGGGASALDDLTDVVLTSPSTGQVLKYNGTNWVNDTDSVGSGSFTYPSAGIAVSTGSAWATSLTDNSANWNTAYTDRLKWDGGSTGLTASTGRTSLGATTVGSNLFTLADPSAITFPRFNADNTVSSLSASDFRTAIGAGTSSTTGTVTSVSWTGGIVSVATETTTPAFTIAGTSGGIPYFSSGTTWASSAALAANALVIGGGAGAAPSTTTTGTGVLTAIGNSVNATGGLVTVDGSATLTNKTLTTPIISSISNTGTLTLPTSTDTLVGRATTDTLTNKRVTPRVSTTTSSATPTINTDTTDVFGITAQTVAITSFTTNLSGTPTDGQTLRIYIVGTAARAITWGASFEASTVALPTTTVSTNRLDVGFVWNAATSKWRCVAVA